MLHNKTIEQYISDYRELIHIDNDGKKDYYLSERFYNKLAELAYLVGREETIDEYVKKATEMDQTVGRVYVLYKEECSDDAHRVACDINILLDEARTLAKRDTEQPVK